MQIRPSTFTTSFLKKEKVSQDAYSFYFARPKDFVFLPGQYIRMIFAHKNPDERGTSRFFSLASSPLQKDYIMITTRIIKSSFKRALQTLTPGVQVQFFGPLGPFIFDETYPRPRVFLAGGIGMTPFHSMILYAEEKNLSIPITLFASFTTVEEMIYYEELNQLHNGSMIQIIYTITQPENSQKPWSGETGRISKEIIEKYVHNYSNSLFMIAGPPAMVLAMGEIVKSMGIPDEQIKKEQFTGY